MFRRFSADMRERQEREKAGEAAVATAQAAPAAPAAPQPKPRSERFSASDAFLARKVELHRHLIERFNLTALETASRPEIEREVRPIVKEFIRSSNFPLNAAEIDRLIEETVDELLGLGPIEPFLKDDTVTDILINTHQKIYIERFGELSESGARFRDEAHLMRIIQKIVAQVGRRVDESSPLVDARLMDGSRVNVAVRPTAIDGPLVSIRKFSRKPFTFDSLIKFGSIAPRMVDFLSVAVRVRKSMLISGGTGSGKTTLLNALSNFIPQKERLITIEDAAELQLQQPHVGRLETRPPNVEGRGEIRQRELVKNSLRMRPDRIIIGEVRGEEAFDMLQAMNTGHEGSMTTIHANSPRDALSRMEQMIGMAGMPMSQQSIRGQIASAIDIVVQTLRLSDGTRRIVSIAEVTGMEGDVIQMQEIYHFVRKGTAEDGRIIGEFRATGVRPRFAGEIKSHGIEFASDAFNPQVPL